MNYYLFMKSLKESLFDQDLVEKEVPIDVDTLKNIFIQLVDNKKSLFDKTDIICHKSETTNRLQDCVVMHIKRFISDSEQLDAVCFELVLNVGARDGELYIDLPELKVHDRFITISNRPSQSGRHQWRTSFSFNPATAAVISRKIGYACYTDIFDKVRHFDYNKVNKIFSLYDEMMDWFCSDSFKKKLKHYVEQFEYKHEIPGSVLDILMKQLINS